MKKCKVKDIGCGRMFPSHLIHPMVSTIGTFELCPLCALKLRNRIHGLNDTQFKGSIANQLLEEARAIIKRREKNENKNARSKTN